MPELGSIRTLIDLELGKLFIESPTRRDKLQLSLLESLADLSEEVDVFGQRYDWIIGCMLSNLTNHPFEYLIDPPSFVLRKLPLALIVL